MGAWGESTAHLDDDMDPGPPLCPRLSPTTPQVRACGNFIITFPGQEERPGSGWEQSTGTSAPEGAEWEGCQMEGSWLTMFTVSTGEEHEDFKTLKEEVQREIQEVKKLSRVGQSSLLTSLSKLLGKKKELQDLELTVRSQRKVVGGGVRGCHNWQGT